MTVYSRRMRITSIDHVYAETLDWDASVTFWVGLGFAFVSEWGSEGHRAGRLECGSAAVVLAEITEGAPAFNVFFDVDDPDDSGLGGVVTPLSDTHWGTRWIRVEDPDGRVHALEETP